jgi:hypothetical protein
MVLSALSLGDRPSGTIIQVQRKIRMSDHEPLSPKEYFIDMGSRDGLSEGEVLQVFRYVPVINGQSGGPWHVLRVNIGSLRVAFVGETSSLAREEEGRSLASLPPLEYHTFMMGDEVARKTSLQSDSKKP